MQRLGSEGPNAFIPMLKLDDVHMIDDLSAIFLVLSNMEGNLCEGVDAIANCEIVRRCQDRYPMFEVLRSRRKQSKKKDGARYRQAGWVKLTSAP